MELVLDIVLGALCLISWGVLLWQWIEAALWHLHRRAKETVFCPSVTLFKPLKGCEARTIECLKSWVVQDYSGKVQILFGVADERDPIVEPLKKLLTRFPQANTELIICKEERGFNRKVSSLIQMASHATGQVWVVSDADILAPSDLLKNLVQPLTQPEVGAVNCLYRISAPPGLAMAFETIGVNADFWSQVIQSLRLDEQNFCLGAVICVDAEAFRKTGGFTPLADLLADDYHIGNRLYKGGKKIYLSGLVVDSIAPKTRLKDVWLHQLRWARTIRFERPVSYALSLISNSSLWAILWALCGNWQGRYIVCAAALLSRLLAVVDLQRRLTQTWRSARYAWMVWAKDLFQFALWIAAFCGNHVLWRGQKFRVSKGGVLKIEK